jgi:RNase P/RNase MRP subunit p30
MVMIVMMAMIIMIIMNNLLFIIWIEPGDALAIRTFAAQQGIDVLSYEVVSRELSYID